MDRSLQARELTIAMLKFSLKTKQDKMKSFADKKRYESEFELGACVYLKLQPHRQLSIQLHKQHKLSPKFYGPFQIVEKIGAVALRLLSVQLLWSIWCSMGPS